MTLSEKLYILMKECASSVRVSYLKFVGAQESPAHHKSLIKLRDQAQRERKKI